MSADPALATFLQSVKLENDDFLSLLKQVIGHSKSLQNNPPALIPKEELVADLVLKYLEPYTAPKGPLTVRKIGYTANRANVIITYPGTVKDKSTSSFLLYILSLSHAHLLLSLCRVAISFVGSHMDVVPANPEEWQRNPFELVIEGDKLFGRGVTDCLGHVCMLTNFFKQLAVAKPKLTHTVAAVFIANEEASAEAGVGIDELVKRGELDFCRHGPLYWVDSANFGPTLGTAGMLTWQLTITGKKFHSGIPHKGINSIELANAVVNYLQERFYKDFRTHEQEEKRYLFAVGSSLKPTQISTPAGSLNQIPGSCTVSGDIRLTPFYNTTYTKQKIESYIAELNVAGLPSHGYSKFHLPDENLKGGVELKWLGQPYEGVAVKLDSPGYKALHEAIAKANGEAKPFSLTGSLPIIRDLQEAGFDVQICGFGRMDAYHANDEYGFLTDFEKGIRAVSLVVQHLEVGF